MCIRHCVVVLFHAVEFNSCYCCCTYYCYYIVIIVIITIIYVTIVTFIIIIILVGLGCRFGTTKAVTTKGPSRVTQIPFRISPLIILESGQVSQIDYIQPFALLKSLPLCVWVGFWVWVCVFGLGCVVFGQGVCVFWLGCVFLGWVCVSLEVLLSAGSTTRYFGIGQNWSTTHGLYQKYIVLTK